jgi:hypothetical protein
VVVWADGGSRLRVGDPGFQSSSSTKQVVVSEYQRARPKEKEVLNPGILGAPT